MTFTETFTSFATAINQHKVDDLAALMTTDHVVVDSTGQQGDGMARICGQQAGLRHLGTAAVRPRIAAVRSLFIR